MCVTIQKITLKRLERYKVTQYNDTESHEKGKKQRIADQRPLTLWENLTNNQHSGGCRCYHGVVQYR